ncbi:MAG: hypothetical protein FJ125_08470 [Deltaproteobacteria bacterium]|nr:hypothetical protein [Deltaproteobacteria bacterium]
MKRALLCSLIAGCVAGHAAEAAAGITLGAGGYLGVPVGEEYGDKLGTAPGLDLRLGYTLPIPLISVTPELASSWVTLPDADEEESFPDHGIRTVAGGLRLGLPGIVAPALFAHAGYGWEDGELDDMILSRSGLSLDGGIAVELTLLPIVSFGAYVAYQALRFDANRNDKEWVWESWLKLGLEVSASF